MSSCNLQILFTLEDKKVSKCVMVFFLGNGMRGLDFTVETGKGRIIYTWFGFRRR